MADIDDQIQRAHIEAARAAQPLPQLAANLCEQAGRWATMHWDQIIRRAIARHTDVGRSALEGLKSELRQYEADATRIARQALEPVVTLHETDPTVALGWVKARPWDRDRFGVSLPTEADLDGCYRLLLGRVGPALGIAGLLSPGSNEVNADGRYVQALPEVPATVATASEEYLNGVRNWVLQLREAEELVEQKKRAAATAMGDEL
jgi:hypothetical protein